MLLLLNYNHIFGHYAHAKPKYTFYIKSVDKIVLCDFMKSSCVIYIYKSSVVSEKQGSYFHCSVQPGVPIFRRKRPEQGFWVTSSKLHNLCSCITPQCGLEQNKHSHTTTGISVLSDPEILDLMFETWDQANTYGVIDIRDTKYGDILYLQWCNLEKMFNLQTWTNS